MNPEAAKLFPAVVAAAAALAVSGLYCLLATRNLLRALIGFEILVKGVTLFLVLAGYASGRSGLGQALVITLIVVEVAVIAVAVCIVLALHRHHRSIDTRTVENLKG